MFSVVVIPVDRYQKSTHNCPQGMSDNPAPAVPTSWLELPDNTIFWLKGRCAVGRQPDNDLFIDDLAFSRQHALITQGPSGFSLVDLHSKNGTYVNRKLVERRVALRDGDEIRVGEYSLRYRCNRSLDAGDGASGQNTTQRLDLKLTRDCWLLVTDIEGYCALNEEIGGESALDRLKIWIADVRPLIERNGGKINGYAGDAVLAYWPCETSDPVRVVGALRALEAYRARSPLVFRFIVHWGSVLFTRGEQGEELTSQDVNFTFRSEKIAKRLLCRSVLSEAAARTLGLEDACARIGESEVDGMTGFFTYYSAPKGWSGAGA
jgi:pSer/pThr/pTyr-binding forkhead associated (FHA) protein